MLFTESKQMIYHRIVQRKTCFQTWPFWHMYWFYFWISTIPVSKVL